MQNKIHRCNVLTAFILDQGQVTEYFCRITLVMYLVYYNDLIAGSESQTMYTVSLVNHGTIFMHGVESDASMKYYIDLDKIIYCMFLSTDKIVTFEFPPFFFFCFVL